MIPLHVPGSKSRYTFVILQSLKPIFKKLLMAAWLPFGRVDIILEATQWCWAKPRITRLTNLSNIILVTNQIWLKATQVSYSYNLYTDFDRDSKIIFKNAFIILLLMKKKSVACQGPTMKDAYLNVCWKYDLIAMLYHIWFTCQIWGVWGIYFSLLKIYRRKSYILNFI